MTEPGVDDPGGDPVTLPPFADTVFAYSDGDRLVTCTDSLLLCDDSLHGCDRESVLGPPDGQTAAIEPGGLIEVGLRCSGIVGTVAIWADVPQGATALVQASFDGRDYTTLGSLRAGPLGDTGQSFGLNQHGLDVVRYVRIVNSSSAAVAIDAVGRPM